MRIMPVKSLKLFLREEAEWRDGDQGNLSAYHRYRLIQAASQLTAPEFAKRVASYSDIKWQTAENALNDRDQADSKAHAAAVDFLNKELKIGPERSVDEVYRTSSFGGPEALKNFHLWLRGIPPWGDGLALWRSGRVLARAGREKQINAINRFLKADDGRSGKPSVLIVHADGLTRGLTALASHIIEEQTAKGSPVCYLPISYMAGEPDIVDAPRLVGWLHNYYFGKPLAEPAALERALSEAGFIEMVEEIRREMARKSAIIILDGHIDRVGGTSALRNLIVDDPVAGVLDMLVQPHGGSADDPSDITTFEKTCFLVLADGLSEALCPYCSHRVLFPPPETIDTLGFIGEVNEDGPIYSHRPQVRAFSQRTGSGSEIELHLVDVLASLGLRSAGDGAAAMVTRLLKALRTQPSKDYLILAWLALTPGGLRHDSLRRLLRRWGRLCATGVIRQDWLCCAAAEVDDQIVAMLQRLKGLFVDVDDNTLPATMRHWLEDIDANPDEPPERRSVKSRENIVFRLPKMRRLFLEALLRDPANREPIALMHFILAEESLRQHTVLMRHAKRMDFSSMRANRRLVQALYHGFLSLRAGEAAREGLVKALPCVLPAPRDKAFMRLYAIFYRNLLEAPPHWEVSRVMSAETVKRDLLLAALNAIADDAGCWMGVMLDEDACVPSLPAWIAAVEPGPLTDAAYDLIVALAHSACQLGELQMVKDCGVLAEALEQRSDREGRSGDRFDDARFHLAKIRIDALILEGDEASIDSARVLIADELKRIKRTYLTDHAWRLAAMLVKRPAGGWEKVDKVISRRMEQLEPSHLPRVADLLARHAETLVPKSEQHLHPDDRVTGEMPYRLLILQAFILLKAAVACRRMVVWQRPLDRSHVASGHWSRTYIRIMLLMLQLRATPKTREYEAILPDKQHLFEELRKEADVLVRYFSRYPAERPSLVIIEAMIVAALTKDLESAHRLLLEADERLNWVVDRPRLRMRLLRERALVLIARAKAAREERAQPRTILRFEQGAMFDAARLSALAKTSQSQYWQDLARQVHKTGKQELGKNWTAKGGPASPQPAAPPGPASA